MIPIDEHELAINHMTKQYKNFIKRVEVKIVNSKQPLFDDMDIGRVYYSTFGDTDNAEENLLFYWGYIQDHKDVEVNEAYIEAIYNYIGSKLVAPGKYSIPFLARVNRRKWVASGNPIGEEQRNRILKARVYKLELPDKRVHKYAANIIIEYIID